YSHFSFLLIPPPPRPTLFPYTTLFRSPNATAPIKVRPARHQAHIQICPSPPSTLISTPVMNEASCEAKNATAPATSSGWPNRILDRKSTRLNSSHLVISYAVFCLKKKK